MSENLWPSRPPKESAAELLRACRWEVAGDAGEGGYKAAYYLFQELRSHLEIDQARRIFLHFGNPPSPRQIKQFKNGWLLDRLHSMKGGPKIQPFAQQIAAENVEFNKTVPREQWRPINPASIEKQIRRLNDQRNARRANAAARRLAAEGRSPQPLRKKKLARKAMPKPKHSTPKRKATRD
jgi:hypothetical protein